MTCMLFRMFAIILSALIVATLATAPAAAPSWPARPVALVVPFAAGGPYMDAP